MIWKDINKAIGRISLAITEYLIKFCAFIAVLVTMAASGSLMEKVASGFGSLPAVFQKIPSAVQQISEQSAVVQDYNTQAMATFAKTHGYDAISSLVLALNDVVSYFSAINQNLSEASLSTLGASAIVFSSFFLVSLLLRIARRKGRDLFWARVEKKVWNQFFETDQPSEESDRKKVTSRASEKTGYDVAFREENEDSKTEEDWSDPTVFNDEEETEEEQPNHALTLVEKPEHEEEIVEGFDEVPQNGHLVEYSGFEDSDQDPGDQAQTNLMSALDLEETKESEIEEDLERESTATIDSEKEHASLDADYEEEESQNSNSDDNTSLDQELDNKELSNANEGSNKIEKKTLKYQNNSLGEFIEMARSSSG